MKVLLLKDVYKLGHAGDIKKVADGYGRNYLLPQGLAVLATPGAIKQAEFIRSRANESRSALNNEMSGISSKIIGAAVAFASKAGETGKLYGSITAQMIAEALSNKAGVTIDRRQIEVQPIRTLGEHKARIHLTIDLVPDIKVIVYREGEKFEIEEAVVNPKVEAASTGETSESTEVVG
jgi:large subunit ribosomal protein L9